MIGQRGATIRSLQEQSGCNIQIPPECAPGTNFRVVTIQGSPEGIAIAMSQIEAMRLLSDETGATPGAPVARPGDAVRILECPNDKVGLIIGRAGTGSFFFFQTLPIYPPTCTQVLQFTYRATLLTAAAPKTRRHRSL